MIADDGLMPAKPRVHVFRSFLFDNLQTCMNAAPNAKPQDNLPKLVKNIVSSPVLSALIFEEVCEQNRGLSN